MKPVYMDDEEKNILDSYDNGEWQSVQDVNAEKRKLREYANNTIHQNNIFQLRLTQDEIDRIQKIANQKGISSQDFITNIVHDYISQV